jgi:hypothetical protein
VLALALGLTGAGQPARADVLGWMNRQLDGLFSTEDAGAEHRPSQDVDGFLRKLERTGGPRPAVPEAARLGGTDDARLGSLSEPAFSRPGALSPAMGSIVVPARRQAAPEPAGRRQDWSPRIQDALAALRLPAGTQQGLGTVEDGASGAAELSARAGFTLPAQVLANLAKGTEPLRRLLVSCREGLHGASSAASIDRLHAAFQRLLGQIQNNHQLVQQARELVNGAQNLLDRSRAPVNAVLERAGEAQAIPLVAAFTEVHLRARSNLESARSYLGRAQANLKDTFRLARSGLSYLEQVKGMCMRSSASTYTLEDRPDAIDKLATGFQRMQETVTKAMEGMQTAHGLLYVNQKGLLELLYTLKSSVAPRPIPDRTLGAVGRAMRQAAETLTGGLQLASTELARQKQWRGSLENYRTPLFELGPLPDWVFLKDTILVGGPARPGVGGPGPDLDRVIASLEQMPETFESEAPAANAPLAGAGVPAMTELPLIELGGQLAPGAAAVEPAPQAAPAPAPEEGGYELPHWY